MFALLFEFFKLLQFLYAVKVQELFHEIRYPVESSKRRCYKQIDFSNFVEFAWGDAQIEKKSARLKTFIIVQDATRYMRLLNNNTRRIKTSKETS